MDILSTIKHIINGVDIDSLNNKIAELESNLRRIKDDNARKLATITRLENKTETLNEDLTREKNKVSIAENKQREFAIKLSESEKKITSLESQNGDLLETQKSLSKDNASLKAKITRRDNKILSLQEEKDQLTETITRLQEDSSILAQKTEDIKKALKDSETINTRNVAEIGRLNTEIDLKNDELEKEKDETKSAKQKLDEINILYTELQKNAIEEKELLSYRISEFDKQCKKLEEDNASLREINSNQVDKISLYESEKKDRDERITNLEKENSDIAMKLKETENEVSKLMTKTEALQDNERNYLSKVEQLELQLKEAQDIITELSQKEIAPLTPDMINDKEGVSEGSNPDTPIDAADSGEENHDVSTEAPDESGDEDDASEGSNSDTPIDAADSSVENHDVSTETQEESEDEDDVLKDDSLPLVYDYGLIPAEKLSIPEVYDIKEEKIINSRDFFSQNENELILWRRNLQEEYLMGHARFICPECKQPVKISGHKLFRGRVCYFAHFKDSDDCPYKTGTNRTKEEIERLKYSLVQESERHKRLKSVISSALQGEKSRAMGVENVECEKRINSDIPYLKWRRPDVYAEYNGRKYVFELQLSTTFVSVIVDRDIFYRLNDYNIIWIFNFEDNEEYVNLYNLMCKDIYYANKRNVFIFDADAEEKSKEKGELVLKCRWLDENGVWSPDKYVTLEMFQYDEEYHKPFIFDADKAYLEKYPEYIERRKQLENSREYLLKALMERQKHEEELEREREEERSNLQLELLNTNKSVERFRSGTKYGYQFEGTTILPAKYTSAEAIGENGYAQVGFNRKIGLVRKDGKEIVPVEYKDVDIINNQHGIVMASYKRVDLWLGDEKFILCNEFNDKEQEVIKETDDGKTKYILRTNTYSYSYTQSYYRDHPICHKNFSGYSDSTLFTLFEDKDYCIIWIGGKTYLLSKNRLSVVNGNYSDINSIGVDLIFIAKDLNTNLWGVIDIQGNIITEFKFARLIPTETEFLIAKYTSESGLYGVIDYQGREYIEPQYEALLYLNSERFAFRKEHLWGICDRLGNVLHEAEYTYIRGFESGSIKVSTLESYSRKWKVEENIPSYSDNAMNLCLLNDKGDIAYTEQNNGHYLVRHSGDLYSILSLSEKVLVDYNLLYVNFVTETNAIIKNTEGVFGFFIDEKCKFFEGSTYIEHLGKETFKFTNYGSFSFGGYDGPTSDWYLDIKIIDNNHFVALKQLETGYYSYSEKYALFSIDGRQITSHQFSSITYEANDRYAVVEDNIKGHINSQGQYIESSSVPITEDGLSVFVKREKYGLKDSNGNTLIPPNYSSIVYLVRNLLVVKKDYNVALYDIKGNPLTDFKYSSITCTEDGSIQATRNNNIGWLDDIGNEIPYVKHFNGGSLLSSFESYSVVNEEKEVLIPSGYAKIELLDNDGLFALWKGGKVAIGNCSNEKTEFIYESVRPIGNQLFVVGRTIPKKVRVRQTGYGHYGNPYTYYTTNTIKEKKYGIIDKSLRTIIPCKYSSISDFDEEEKLTATNTKGEKKVLSLKNLSQKASHVFELTIGMEYEAKVKSFMGIGLIVKIQGESFIIHKKHLFKDKNNFKKGDLFIAKYLGNDKYDHPRWTTKALSNQIDDNADVNIKNE
ncbi:MAG: DUF6035 family protein [Prevotella sp.]|nr:DUF6035 family protein [Prevotella sp.]